MDTIKIKISKGFNKFYINTIASITDEDGDIVEIRQHICPDFKQLIHTPAEVIAEQAANQYKPYYLMAAEVKALAVIKDAVLEHARQYGAYYVRRTRALMAEKMELAYEAAANLAGRERMKEWDAIPSPKPTTTPHSCVRRRVANSDEFDPRMHW